MLYDKNINYFAKWHFYEIINIYGFKPFTGTQNINLNLIYV